MLFPGLSYVIASQRVIAGSFLLAFSCEIQLGIDSPRGGKHTAEQFRRTDML